MENTATTDVHGNSLAAECADELSLSISIDRGIRWPVRPAVFGELMTPIEAAQYLRLDETGLHTPVSAVRTLNYWRDKRQLKATKFARHVWYRRIELDRFLELKTEQ